MIRGDDLRQAREDQGVSLRELGRRIGLSAGHLSRVEREAESRFPSPNIVYLYESTLGIKVAATSESVRTPNLPSNVEDVNRRDMLSAASSVAVAASVELVLPPPRSRKIRPEDIEQVDVALTAFNAWDHAFGGGHALEVGRPHVDWANALLHDDCEPKLRPRLFAAVGGLVASAGFMAFDAFRHKQARDFFYFALQCADEADDANLHARVLSSMARQAVWCGRPADALSYIERALTKHDRHTPTGLAELETIRARAWAKTGPASAQKALAAVGRADELFARSDPANDPKWIKFYDAAQHHGDTAHALFDLEVHGITTDARSRFEFAVAHHGAGFTRSRTFSQIKLATLIILAGDPCEAASVGGASVGAASRLRSSRARTELMALRTVADRRGHADACELAQRIDESIVDTTR